MTEQDKRTLAHYRLRVTVWDGLAYAVMVGVGETYLAACAIFLGASRFQVGLLSSFPQFMSALMQGAAAWVVERYQKRRGLIVRAAVIQGLIWIPIALLPLVMPQSELAIEMLIVFSVAYHLAAGFIAPIWNSLVGDLVPPTLRGRFFGSRNMKIGIVLCLSLAAGGGVLEAFSIYGYTAVGFTTIFLLAFCARMVSSYWLSKYDDPEFHYSKEHHFSFIEFIKATPRSNFAKFTFFISTMSLGVALSGPYVSVYFLRDLKFSYWEFTVLTAATSVMQFLAMHYWGKLTDHFGNKKIMTLCSYGLSTIPVLLVVSPQFSYLILVQLYAGFVWAGFNLSAANYIFDAVTPPKRARCAAFMAIVNGAFHLTGALCGSGIATILPDTIVLLGVELHFVSSLPVLFLVSALLRFLTARAYFPHFAELREVQPITHKELVFRVTHVGAIAGLTFSLLSGEILRRHRRKQS